MNQIPNIEETHNTREVEEVVKEFYKIFDTDNLWQGEDEWTKNVPIGNIEQWLRTTLHQQLQKARQDWLQEEIVKLEGMKRYIESEEPFVPWYKPDGMSEEEYAYHIHNHEQKRARWEADCEWNQALDNVINRYNEELDQDKK